MKVGQISRKNQIILMVLMPLVVFAVFYSLYLSSTLEELEKLKKENESLKAQIQTANQLVARYEQLKAINLELQKRIEQLKSLLPTEVEVSGLLRKVSEQGIQKGLQVNLWRPKGKLVHESKEIYVIPVEVRMRGKYHMFGSFFADIAKFERIVNVQSFELKSGGQESREGALFDPTNLFANLTITTYSVIPDEERRKLQEQKDKK